MVCLSRPYQLKFLMAVFHKFYLVHSWILRSAEPRVYLGDTVYSCYCKFRLKIPPWWGLRGRKILILTNLDRWKRHFREQNYIENYFYLLKSTKSTKTNFQKYWRNIIWADCFGRPYRSNGIKTRLGSPVYRKETPDCNGLIIIRQIQFPKY